MQPGLKRLAPYSPRFLHTIYPPVLNYLIRDHSLTTKSPGFFPTYLYPTPDPSSYYCPIIDKRIQCSHQSRLADQSAPRIAIKHTPLHSPSLDHLFETVGPLFKPTTVLRLHRLQIPNEIESSKPSQLLTPSFQKPFAFASSTSLHLLWSIPPFPGLLDQTHSPLAHTEIHKLQQNIDIQQFPQTVSHYIFWKPHKQSHLIRLQDSHQPRPFFIASHNFLIFCNRFLHLTSSFHSSRTRRHAALQTRSILSTRVPGYLFSVAPALLLSSVQ